MKKLKWWGVVGLAAAGIVLSGCGGSNSSSDTASLRLVNATLTHTSLDLLVNSGAAATGVAADTASAYVAPSSGSNTLQINDTTSSTALATTVPTLTAGNYYTLLAYESGGAVKTAVLSESLTTPTSSTAQIRIYNAGLDAGKLDVYITDPSTALSSAVSPATNFITGTVPAASGQLVYSPGTYRVRVTGYGKQSDLRLDIPSVTLTNQQIATIVLTPASGGILLNGSTLIQQGDYAATRNTNVRVRLAAAVSNSASVAASATSGTTTTTIASESTAPAFGDYALVPASSTLNISVNGGSVSAPAPTLASLVGNDVTLLVHGDAGSAAASLITDDNRPPTDATTTKLNVINGLTGTTGTLTLTANSATVATNLATGAASGYASVASAGVSSPMSLILNLSTASGTWYKDTTSYYLSQDGVYSILVGGDGATTSTPQLLVK